MQIKAVFDSATIVSAFLVPTGLANKLLRCAHDGAFVICLSNEILAETKRVLLEYPHIRKRYQYTDLAVMQYLKNLEVVSRLAINPPPVKLIADDPNDDMIIACALHLKAGYIVSRDEHLLSFGIYKKIQPISPEDFIRLLREKNII